MRHVARDCRLRRRALRSAAHMPDSSPEPRIGLLRGPWPKRLEFVMSMMREISRQNDAQSMVQTYGRRMREVLPSDGFVSLSRRELQRPLVRVTRSHLWGNDVNPWQARERVILDRGLLSDLIWTEDALVVEDFCLQPNDPGAPFLEGMRSLVAVPLFDRGAALNMFIALSRQPNGFAHDDLPERVWMSNLFGRATHNLVLSDELKRAYETVDRELKVVADLQRSLLPRQLPAIPTLELAAHYQTSRRAGGDYYDFFELPDGRWGILIADVSGHGTPAAVMMAVTHSIAHTHDGPPTPPSKLLAFINSHLTARYTNGTGSFVTAFYGIYDPENRTLTYACAGHCPPRLKRPDGALLSLDHALSLPLGIDGEERFFDHTETLRPGDALVLYTDGITEARKPGTDELEMFGLARLDRVLTDCACDPESIIRRTLLAVEAFSENSAPHDDITMLVAKVT
jgi:sigma-B regulation protein RsbU (phosphoserine phosphatase)